LKPGRESCASSRVSFPDRKHGPQIELAIVCGSAQVFRKYRRRPPSTPVLCRRPALRPSCFIFFVRRAGVRKTSNNSQPLGLLMQERQATYMLTRSYSRVTVRRAVASWSRSGAGCKRHGAVFTTPERMSFIKAQIVFCQWFRNCLNIRHTSRRDAAPLRPYIPVRV
jgi:hypothetical protein